MLNKRYAFSFKNEIISSFHCFCYVRLNAYNIFTTKSEHTIFNEPSPASFRLFSSFQTNITIFTTNWIFPCFVCCVLRSIKRCPCFPIQVSNVRGLLCANTVDVKLGDLYQTNDIKHEAFCSQKRPALTHIKHEASCLHLK